MEGVNLRGLLRSLSRPLFTLSLSLYLSFSFTYAHTVEYIHTPPSRKWKEGFMKKRKEREEKLEALTNDLING